ncbi:type 1 fimbrial protein [Enterobacter quasihormaechei]|uniref:fimbrial protein n=1 Tax=Enterobacter quasihormaechei TaxID=2529382 RepID=UPI002F42E971
MNKFLKLSVLSLLMSASSLWAADGTLSFKGTVTNATCEVKTPSLVFEGLTNAVRWKNPYTNISLSKSFDLAFDCGELTNAPGIRFTAQTGVVVGTTNEPFLAITGSASGVAIALQKLSTYPKDTINPNFTGSSLYLLDGETYSTGKTSTDGDYVFGVRAFLVGLEPYNDSFNGDFEAVVGYDLIYI